MPRIKRDSEEAELLRPQEAEMSATFGTCDLALFKSGDHSDVTIHCGEQRFPIHKAILYGRCGWFRDRLKEIEEVPQQPGQIPVIEVADHQPIDVEAILVFIYSGEIDPGFFPDEPYPYSCVHLYNLGHVFHVNNLSDFATTELGNYLSNVLKSICDQRLWVPAVDQKVKCRTEIQDRLRRANFMRNFLAAVELADRVRRSGATETDRLRPYQMLVDFFIAGEELLLSEPEFELWLESDVVPSFAKTVLLTRKRGGCRSKWMYGLVGKPSRDSGRQGLCVDCNTGLKNIKQCGGPGFANPRSWKGSYTQILCRQCCEREKNLGEDGDPLWEVFDPRRG